VIAVVVVVFDEPAGAGFEIARQVVVFQQDAILERGLDSQLGRKDKMRQ
jgi:hypothetical protein